MDKIERDVLNFIEEISEEIGKYKKEEYQGDMYNECIERGVDGKMKSPIEHILYCSLKAIEILNDLPWYCYLSSNGEQRATGLLIKPQSNIGKYRCDFIVKYYYPNNTLKVVIVECDSQQWHERDEKERRYEKARDRYLTKLGFKIFHYTGKEILKNPMIVAREIVAYLIDINENDILINYDI